MRRSAARASTADRGSPSLFFRFLFFSTCALLTGSSSWAWAWAWSLYLPMRFHQRPFCLRRSFHSRFLATATGASPRLLRFTAARRVRHRSLSVSVRFFLPVIASKAARRKCVSRGVAPTPLALSANSDKRTGQSFFIDSRATVITSNARSHRAFSATPSQRLTATTPSTRPTSQRHAAKVKKELSFSKSSSLSRRAASSTTQPASRFPPKWQQATRAA
mmetsp:Transcript_38028/g.122077  ORF Transcript_38028/g.122077 Transcript_38028/m.122077 type:complete len:219 (+) Transcript_38028:676-1332(+)